MKILLIDDHKMFREGITTFLTEDKKDWEITNCQSIDEGIEYISRDTYDIIISDYHMPGKTIEDLSEYLSSMEKEIPIIILSMDTEISSLIKSLNCGVRGYISKESSSTFLLESIEKVLQGEIIFDQRITKEITSFLINKSIRSEKKINFTLKGLSKREEEIFYLLIDEKEISEISKTLRISKKTIENHRTNIYRKLGVFDKYSLQKFAIDNGLN
jgi:DNA-binding NarL/FixJ family response regulator